MFDIIGHAGIIIGSHLQNTLTQVQNGIEVVVTEFYFEMYVNNRYSTYYYVM